MAKPELPMAITLNDLIKCQQGDIIVSMLIDAKAFFDYDQRENGQTLEVYDDFWYANSWFEILYYLNPYQEDVYLLLNLRD